MEFNYMLKTSDGKTMRELEPKQILEQVAKRKLNVFMVYSELSDIFHMLNLQGYKRLYEYKRFEEEKSFLKIKKWCIDKYGVIPVFTLEPRKQINPYNVKNIGQMTKITAETKKKIIQEIFQELDVYLAETLKLLEEASTALLEKSCIADFRILEKNCKYLEKTIKKLKREWIKLNDVGYSLEFILETQEELHKKYKEKIKEIEL